MLCVLREDFLIELYGIIDPDLGRLDDNDAGYRTSYFWRNSLRTLEEIRNMMNRLNTHETFREAMAKQHDSVKDAFEQLKKSLNKASDEFLRDMRNTIGGHLDEPTFQEGLDGMDPLEEGLIQVGETRDKLHYKFATELVWATFGPDPGKVVDLIKKTAELNPALAAIDHVVEVYMKDRGLP